MNKNTVGFTLIELIIYVALIAIFISGAITFSWDVIYGGAKSAIEREVNQNIRLASKRIVYEIRNASAINSIAANSVCLASATPARNPTRIYLSNGKMRIAWGGGSGDCTNMTNDLPLTSDQVTVAQLTLTNRSSGALSTNIEFSITLASNASRQEWQQSQSYGGTAELRSH